MSNIIHSPRIKTKTLRGEPRQYYSVPFVPGFIARQEYFGFPDGIDVQPPKFRHRQHYPAHIEPGHGVAVVNSPILTLIPLYVLLGIALLIAIFLGIMTRQLLGFLIVAMPVSLAVAALAWVAYLNWLCTALVIQEHSVTLYRHIYATDTKTLQGADIGSVELTNPDPTWILKVITRWLDISIITVELQGGSSSKKDRNFVLHRIGNGAAVKHLLDDLQTSWEASLAESKEIQENTLDVLIDIRHRFDHLGEHYAAERNRARQTDTEILQALNTIIMLLSGKPVPSSQTITTELPIVHPRSDGPYDGEIVDDEEDEKG